jgi:hypothetical protein
MKFLSTSTLSAVGFFWKLVNAFARARFSAFDVLPPIGSKGSAKRRKRANSASAGSALNLAPAVFPAVAGTIEFPLATGFGTESGLRPGRGGLAALATGSSLGRAA